MIAFLGNALDLLDEQGREEVLQFIASQQNSDGGFRDRGGRSDLYYSLFGGMMQRAAEKETGDRRPETEDRRPEIEDQRPETGDRRPEIEATLPERSTGHSCRSREAVEGISSQLVDKSLLKFREFIDCQSNSKVPGFIERCCLALLQKEFGTGRFSRLKSLLSLGRSFWEERHSINLSYRSFVLFLTLDAVFPFPAILKRLSWRISSGTTVNQHSPCSEVAAKVFLQKKMNQDGTEEQKLLTSFVCESGGFKAFQHLQQADMLSTAVALFALDYAGYDLRVLRPASLDFIQSNFADGAFLSGDGDQTADVEYTFYGLLALGVLAK